MSLSRLPLLAAATALTLLSVGACSKPAPVPSPSAAGANSEKGAPAKPEGADDPTGPARVGQPSPDFTLTDLDGNVVSLKSFRGKTVVLEWFNPGCPFVQRSHTKGSLIDTARRHTDNGVVWLAINSGGPGKQGHDPALNRQAIKDWNLPHSVLRDEDGTVGRTYGATHTPHMFIVDAEGVLRYAGAIDNSPDAEGLSPQGGPLTNHVDAALADLAAGRPVGTSSTQAYGCSVKYAK